jgi:hypothetical protein
VLKWHRKSFGGGLGANCALVKQLMLPTNKNAFLTSLVDISDVGLSLVATQSMAHSFAAQSQSRAGDPDGLPDPDKPIGALECARDFRTPQS